MSYPCLLKGRVQRSQHWRPQRTCREPVCFAIHAVQATAASGEMISHSGSSGAYMKEAKRCLKPTRRDRRISFWIEPQTHPKFNLIIYVYKQIAITTQCTCGESSRAAPPTCGVVMQQLGRRPQTSRLDLGVRGERTLLQVLGRSHAVLHEGLAWKRVNRGEHQWSHFKTPPRRKHTVQISS